MLNWNESLELSAAEREEARKRAADDIEKIQARLAKARKALKSIAGESERERRFADRQKALIRIDEEQLRIRLRYAELFSDHDQKGNPVIDLGKAAAFCSYISYAIRVVEGRSTASEFGIYFDEDLCAENEAKRIYQTSLLRAFLYQLIRSKSSTLLREGLRVSTSALLATGLQTRSAASKIRMTAPSAAPPVFA
jgi:hypothetical protein